MSVANNSCWYCGAENAASKCSKCLHALYCSITCQKSDWKIHKHSCKNPENKPENKSEKAVSKEECACEFCQPGGELLDLYMYDVIPAADVDDVLSKALHVLGKVRRSVELLEKGAKSASVYFKRILSLFEEFRDGMKVFRSRGYLWNQLVAVGTAISFYRILAWSPNVDIHNLMKTFAVYQATDSLNFMIVFKDIVDSDLKLKDSEKITGVLYYCNAFMDLFLAYDNIELLTDANTIADHVTVV